VAASGALELLGCSAGIGDLGACATGDGERGLTDGGDLDDSGRMSLPNSSFAGSLLLLVGETTDGLGGLGYLDSFLPLYLLEGPGLLDRLRPPLPERTGL
jgi:hypothetical protein